MKRKFRKPISVFVVASLLSLSVSAAENNILNDNEQVVIAPACLIDLKKTSFKILGQQAGLVLLQAKSRELAQIRLESRSSTCSKFRDVTSTWNHALNQGESKLNKSSQAEINIIAHKILKEESGSTQFKANMPINVNQYELQHPQDVAKLLSHFNDQKMWEYLSKMTSFPNRFSKSQNGVDAANWLKTQAEDIANLGARTDITTEFVQTGSPYLQPSLLVKIPGTDPSLDPILLGAHMDTLDGFMPGADDDGSGSSVTLEVMRVAVLSQMKFKRTVYFAWYAAEEQGLIGSAVVAQKFKSENKSLRAVLHQEVSGYQPFPQNKIYLMEDFVDPSLTQFVAKLAQTYAKTEVGYSRCGYPCSDHVNWTRQGYRVALPVEGAMQDSSPYMHSANDNMSNVSIDHMSRFAKIGIAFVGELADPY